MTTKLTASDLDAIEALLNAPNRILRRDIELDEMLRAAAPSLLASARREARMRESLENIRDGIIGKRPLDDEHKGRAWWSGGTWLHPGDLIAEFSYKDLQVLDDIAKELT